MYRKGKKKTKMRLDISKLLEWDAAGREGVEGREGGRRGYIAEAERKKGLLLDFERLQWRRRRRP
jgi:hypothetical protein